MALKEHGDRAPNTASNKYVIGCRRLSVQPDSSPDANKAYLWYGNCYICVGYLFWKPVTTGLLAVINHLTVGCYSFVCQLYTLITESMIPVNEPLIIVSCYLNVIFLAVLIKYFIFYSNVDFVVQFIKDFFTNCYLFVFLTVF